MVDYREWTAIAFDVARRKGLRVGGPGGQQTLAGGVSFAGDEPQNRFMTVVAHIWNENEGLLRGLDRSDARSWAEDRIETVGPVHPDGSL